MRGQLKTLSIVSVILLLSVACGGGSDRDVTANSSSTESSNSETDNSREPSTEPMDQDSAPAENESPTDDPANSNESLKKKYIKYQWKKLSLLV